MQILMKPKRKIRFTIFGLKYCFIDKMQMQIKLKKKQKEANTNRIK